MRLSGCLAVFSDAHGNVEALKLAFDIAKKNGAKQFVYLGDSLGYIPTVSALEFLQASQEEILFVRGNHEEAVINFREKTESDQITKHSVIQELLSPEQMDFIRSWHLSVSLEYDSGVITFVHGTPTDPLNGYLYADNAVAQTDRRAAYKVLIVGNTHIPFITRVQDKVVVNVGSVGIPRDHGKMGSFALLDLDVKKLRIIRFSLREIQEAVRYQYKSLIHPKVLEVFDRVATYKEVEETSFD